MRSMILCLIVLGLIPLSAHSENSMEGLVRYTTDCPAIEMAVISLKFHETVGDINQATAIMDQRLDVIKNTLTKNINISHSIQSSDFKVDEVIKRDSSDSKGQGQREWGVSGSIVLYLNSGQDAQKAFVALSESGFISSLSVRSSKPENCKK